MTRRRWVLAAILAAWAPAGVPWAQAPAPDGFRTLAREKSLAQQFAELLNELGRRNMEQYKRGIVLYANAKAEFDGLISELEHQLGQRQAPDEAAAFRDALAQAVEKRVAFTDFVTKEILPRSSGTTKGVGAFVQMVPELLKVLMDAGLSIWRDYRSGDEARRRAIRDEIEKLRWPPFRVTGAGP